MIGTDHGCIVRERVDRLKATLAFVRAVPSSSWRRISSGRLTGVCCECTKVRHISRDQYFLKKSRVSVRLKERRNSSDPGWRQGFGVYQKQSICIRELEDKIHGSSKVEYIYTYSLRQA